MTGVELELLTDPDMYLFVEEGLRGGISMITHRHAKANNPYVQDYNPEQPHNYLMYLDANNLYGWAMSQSLPVNNFGWLCPGEVEELQENLMTLSDDGTEGYILEVDLEYPKELHDLHNDYPLAPERQKVPQDWLSPYCHQLIEELELNFTPTEKLVPNLNDKTHYILHYRNLKQYLSLGMKLTKVHRVLGFDQSPWLKKYIDFNTEKRKQARNDFEKDFFKLMNNSVFGKTMENLRKRVSVRLVNTPKQLKKLTANPLFDYFRIFDENLVGVNMKKPTLYLNRPIYVGFCILDLSKVLMYDFHYHVIKQKYGNNATLLFTDTDSLCYNIQTEDIYEDMQQDHDLYDTSEYPRNHVLHSTVNKKVLGKMKDETHGLPIEEFVVYALKYSEILTTVPKKFRSQAEGLLRWVKKTPEAVKWDDRGVVSLDGTPIQGSSISDLVNDVLRTRRGFSPAGRDDFTRVLAKLNTPEDFIRNEGRRKLMALHKIDESLPPSTPSLPTLHPSPPSRPRKRPISPALQKRGLKGPPPGKRGLDWISYD
ncbi:hypothetical protein QZH41_001987 [Actinostola sp. cb2023]|nr:hypothetical protein QZH41_001987 [Actinostola sp. cb2023]